MNILIPEGRVGRTALAYIQAVIEMADKQGSYIKELEISYKELGEYSGDLPYPTLNVKLEEK